MKKQLLLLLLALLLGCAGCANSTPNAAPSSDSQGTREVVDAMDNHVTVPGDIARIAVTPLPWSSVIYAIDGSSSRLVAINPGAMSACKGHFLETLDPAYADLDTSPIGKDFSVNVEELANRQTQALVLWDHQSDVAEQVKSLGITPVMVKNETLEDLQKSFTAIGQLLGKEDRAKAFNDLYQEVYDELKAKEKDLAQVEKPRVLYLRDKSLKIQGTDMFIQTGLSLAGAENIAQGQKSLTMEEILKKDPEIIFLSQFDDFTPEDLYENRLDGQDWSQVSAVKNKRVYKTPLGIYRWDAPGVETPLMMCWLAEHIQPKVFPDIDTRERTQDFFKTYFNRTLSKEDLSMIFAEDANAKSLPPQ